jgi:hypothetical protein
MTQISLEADVSKRLDELDQPAELCDLRGRVIGRFIPLVNVSEWEPVSPDISEEELDRRSRSEEKRYTTAEVLAHLEKS